MKKQILTAFMSAVVFSSVSFAMPAMAEHGFKHRSLAPHEFDHAKMEERMQERRAEFAEKLQLTDDQKAAADKIREENKSEMEPLVKQMKELREKAKELREKGKARFEEILTPEQRETLKEMQKERQEKMQKEGKRMGAPRAG